MDKQTFPPLRAVLPNLFTLLVSLSGLAAMGVAYATGKREAAWALLAAGFFDICDGALARRLNGQTRFGNMYDSMSDFLAFGIAPGLSLVFLGLLHPLAALWYILAIQFRLTRFSAHPETESAGPFFRGLSAPDAVYVAVLIGLVPGVGFTWGFALSGLLAVYPGKLWPRGLRPIKLAVAAATMAAFIYG